ncbi:MAG TPA: hypothetical protein VGA79_12380 [Desulfobaccales bacterium]
MRRKSLILALAALVLGAALAGGLYWRWYHSPRYALQQMALALHTRNLDNFFKYIELKEIFNNFLEASIKDLESEDKPGANEWDRMTRRLGRKFARSLLPKVFDTFETQIRGAMEKDLLNLDNSQIIAIAAAVTVAKIDTRGDEARVTLTNPKTGELIRFQMRRHVERDRWQVVSVNYQDLKRFLHQ